MSDIIALELALDYCFNEMLHMCDFLSGLAQSKDRKLFVQSVLTHFINRTNYLEIDELFPNDIDLEDDFFLFPKEIDDE